jgi:hypothetical protein
MRLNSSFLPPMQFSHFHISTPSSPSSSSKSKAQYSD